MNYIILFSVFIVVLILVMLIRKRLLHVLAVQAEWEREVKRMRKEDENRK